MLQRRVGLATVVLVRCDDPETEWKLLAADTASDFHAVLAAVMEALSEDAIHVEVADLGTHAIDRRTLNIGEFRTEGDETSADAHELNPLGATKIKVREGPGAGCLAHMLVYLHAVLSQGLLVAVVAGNALTLTDLRGLLAFLKNVTLGEGRGAEVVDDGIDGVSGKKRIVGVDVTLGNVVDTLLALLDFNNRGDRALDIDGVGLIDLRNGEDGLALAVAKKDFVADSLGTRRLSEGAERATGRIADDSRTLGNRVDGDGKRHHSSSGSEKTDYDSHLEGCYVGDSIGDTDGSCLLE